MVEKQVIRPSRSPWGLSVVLVPKKDGTKRFCVDYRRLNEHTIKDVYPLPRIDATLDQLGGAKYFTTLDLTSGFWQVEMAAGSAEKTAFTTPMGLYEFQVMPFGLCNAPATFQRLMDSVIGHLGNEFVLVYLDDVLIFSRTFEEHVLHLRKVLACIRDANLCIKLKKCHFAQLRTAYLGHVISGQGIEPDPEKLTAVKELLPPKNVKEVRGFLGFVGFYRRFIQDFGTLARPLHDLTKKKHVWEWTADCQKAFEALRDALLVQPVLTAPDFSKEFTVRCDASYIGLGAILTQGEGEERKVISYASRTLKDAETRYTATEIECLAMKWSVAHFRPYIHGTHFTLETDHVALTWLRTVQHSNARLIRTALALQDLDMKVVHKAGITMHDADALSRLRRKKKGEEAVNAIECVAEEVDDEKYDSDGSGGVELAEWGEEAEVCEENVKLVEEWNAVRTREPEDSDEEETLPDKIRQQIAEHPVFSVVLEALEGVHVPPEKLNARVRQQLELLVARDGLLYRVDQLYRGGRAVSGNTRLRLFIPPALRKDVLFACHDHLMSGGHLGIQRTFDKIRARYYWGGLYKDVQEWCANCRECARRKGRHDLRLPVMSVPIPAEPWEFVSVDVMGPFVTARGSGNKFIAVYCDHLTRYVETIAMRVQDTKSLARGLVERVMCRHGCPRTLLSDRGLPFLSELAHEVYRLLRVRKLDTAGYRPQTNGLVERFNQTFATMLSMYVNSRHTDWDVYLPYLTFAYNTGAHPATKESPFYLVHGREPRLPLDVQMMPRDEGCNKVVEEYRAELVEGLHVAREFSRNSLQRDQQQRSRPPPPARQPPTYRPGDQVLVRMEPLGQGMSRKLHLKWAGPFRVVRELGTGGRRYGVTDNRGVERPVDVMRMKKFVKHTHPTVVEGDYADHFATAGEALTTECNRGRAPEDEHREDGEEDEDERGAEQQAAGESQEADSPDSMPASQAAEQADDTQDSEEEQNTPATQVLGSGDEQGSGWEEGGGLDLGGEAAESESEAGDGEAAAADRPPRNWTTVDPRTWTPPERNTRARQPPREDLSEEEGEDLTAQGLRLRGTDADGGASQLCRKCHAGRRGHKCSGVYRPARQAEVMERRRGKNPSNNVPLFGIALKKRGSAGYEYRGVFAPYDLREMEGNFERFEQLVEQQEGRKARADDWNDFCEKCGKKGGLTMCLGCNLVFHERCLVSKVIDGGLKRNEELICPDCAKDMHEKGGGERGGASQQ